MGCLQKTDKIFVAGHNGLVGSAILETLKKKGYKNLLTRSREELDLTEPLAVRSFFEREKPDVIFLAAAKVGGILANNTRRADFIYENLAIQNNVIWAAHSADVKRFLFLGSSCIYPRNAPQPMPETSLLTSELEFTNRPYAIAKIAGLELVNTLRQQYGRDYFSVMPTNLYGPNDKFDINDSHVLPALLKKFILAKQNRQSEVQIWGTGKPLREFMYSIDCADAIVFLAETLTTEKLSSLPVGTAGWSHINIGSGQEVTISDLSKAIADTVGFAGRTAFDATKPDGTPRKLLDCSTLTGLGWKSKMNLREGLKMTYKWLMEHPQLLK